ncbi:probable G-protein coupled receptor No9 [Dendronephthya gigantea]|uniref:probable G-protein coupled receptor No9 n=1 Tax=Dendronephthya gigantea TaxID=151771 RepID=UPI0010698E45|nr:probable G-protein coupled receptor No9 [Dendronephthya gigantea]XP_028390861.1 probable G-protein coupled receptor No9 [Dendronephthya gigantea]
MESKTNTSILMSNSTPYGLVNPPPFNLGLVIVLGALIPLTVVGNFLVCFAFVRYQKVRTATNCFLVSLAASDLAVGLLLIPLWIAFIVTGGFQEMPKSFHDGWYVLDITCSVASMANLAGVSVERWYGVCYPFRHISMSKNCAIITSIASWVYGLGIGSLYLFYDPQNPWAITAITCLGLCLPIVIMTIAYCAIARKIRRKTLRTARQSGIESKTIRTLVLLSTIFVLCWLPFVVGSLLVNYCKPCMFYVLKRPALHIFPKVLHYANSCVNPVLYSLFSPSFKSAFRQIFNGSHRSSNGTQRRSMLLSDRSGSSGSQKMRSNGSVTIKFKNREKLVCGDNSNRDSSETEKFV